MPTRNVPLSDKGVAFCEAYLANGHNASAAYRAAGYSAKHAGRDASRLLRRPAIVARLAELEARHVEDEACSLSEHLRALALIREGAMQAGNWAAAASAEVARGRARGHQGRGPQGADAPPSPSDLRPLFDRLAAGQGAPAPQGQHEPTAPELAPRAHNLDDSKAMGPQSATPARVPGKRDSDGERKRLSEKEMSARIPGDPPKAGPVWDDFER